VVLCVGNGKAKKCTLFPTDYKAGVRTRKSSHGTRAKVNHGEVAQEITLGNHLAATTSHGAVVSAVCRPGSGRNRREPTSVTKVAASLMIHPPHTSPLREPLSPRDVQAGRNVGQRQAALVGLAAQTRYSQAAQLTKSMRSSFLRPSLMSSMFPAG